MNRFILTHIQNPLSLIILSAGVLSLSACTNLASPALAPDASSRGQVSQAAEQMAQDGRYTLTYLGAPGDGPTKVRNMTLVRAANLTLQKQGDWFEVIAEYSRLEERQPSRFEADPFGEQANIRAECGLLGCPSTARPETGQGDIDLKGTRRTYLVQSMEIKVHQGPLPPDRQNAYDAVSVSKVLQPHEQEDGQETPED